MTESSDLPPVSPGEPAEGAPTPAAAPTPTPPPAPSTLDQRLEAEIAEALGDMSLDELLDVPAAPRPAAAAPAKGTIHREFRTGTVVGVRGGDVLVEFGPKSTGICPLTQFEEAPPAGTRLEFVVERHDPKEGTLVLSREGAVQKAHWESLAVGQVVEAVCTAMNKGGLEFEVAHHKAFMPAGQVDVRHIPDISIFLGQKVPCEITQIDRKRGRIVLSRKSLLEKERARAADQVLAELEQGQERDATIVSVQPYGAFADIGGVDGLIHVSDMAYERVGHPSDIVKVGDTVRVRVLRIDRKQTPPKIALGLKQLTADPAATALESLEVGATVSGKVTKLMPFGAFIEVAPGVDGLVHISEISHDRIPSVEHALKRDQVVTARVLSVDAGKKRVSLSIKALVDRPASPQRGHDRGHGRGDRDAMSARPEDPALRKLKARFGSQGQGLKGGIA